MLHAALRTALLASAAAALAHGPTAHASGERHAETRVAKGSASLAPRFFFTGARTTASVATTVHCSNFGATGTTMQVALYSFLGLPQFTSVVLSLPVGRTSTISFDADNGDAEFYTDDGLVITEEIDQGRGEIRLGPDAAGVACTAQVLDSDASPPSFVITLPLFLVGPDGLPVFDDGFEALAP